ncbi:hypothetical protein C8R47DRAFT_1082782 [Mycena vitilis]|nr:hypothetical protein C8R47DRAFT_1082782 [Mycena vitilis]
MILVHPSAISLPFRVTSYSNFSPPVHRQLEQGAAADGPHLHQVQFLRAFPQLQDLALSLPNQSSVFQLEHAHTEIPLYSSARQIHEEFERSVNNAPLRDVRLRRGGLLKFGWLSRSDREGWKKVHGQLEGGSAADGPHLHQIRSLHAFPQLQIHEEFKRSALERSVNNARTPLRPAIQDLRLRWGGLLEFGWLSRGGREGWKLEEGIAADDLTGALNDTVHGLSDTAPRGWSAPAPHAISLFARWTRAGAMHRLSFPVFGPVQRHLLLLLYRSKRYTDASWAKTEKVLFESLQEPAYALHTAGPPSAPPGVLSSSTEFAILHAKQTRFNRPRLYPPRATLTMAVASN